MRYWRLPSMLLASSIVALAACTPQASEPEPTPAIDPALAAAQAEADAKAAEEARAKAEAALAECKAVELLDLVGQPQTALTDILPGDARVIEPGGIITQDYRPQRVNIDLDADGNIARIWCG